MDWFENPPEQAFFHCRGGLCVALVIELNITWGLFAVQIVQHGSANCALEARTRYVRDTVKLDKIRMVG